MKSCECSQCGNLASIHVWGFSLFVRDGWGVVPHTDPPGSGERAWLCGDCHRRAQIAARAIERLANRMTPRSKEDDTIPSRPLRVLLIDDHVLMLRSMARVLTGYECVTTTSPWQALAVLQHGAQFDVIVCDVMMPEMSGPDLYKRCFLMSPELSRRFVFASAEPRAARRLINEAVADLGVAITPPLLLKPTSREALISAVHEVSSGVIHESGGYTLRFPSNDASSLPGLDTPAEAPVRRSSSGYR